MFVLENTSVFLNKNYLNKRDLTLVYKNLTEINILPVKFVYYYIYQII